MSTTIHPDVTLQRLPVTWEPKALITGVIGAAVLIELAFVAFGMPDVSALGSSFLYERLGDSFILTLLAAGMVFTAAFTAVASWEQVRMKVHVAAPVIGVAVCWAAAIDVYYYMLSDALVANVEGAAAKANVIAFVWAVCRACSGFILVSGAALIVRRRGQDPHDSDMTLINIIGPVVFVVGYSVARFVGTSPAVTSAVHDSTWLHRPWDLLPLAVYFIGGVAVFPALYRQIRTQFALAIWLAAIPAFAAHAHMAFGSGAAFDRSFFLAHVLVLVAYLSRLGGLLLDHSRTYAEVRLMNDDLVDQATKRHAAEQSVEAIYGKLIEAMPVPAFRKNANGRFTFVNEAFARRVNRPAEEIVGLNDEDLFPYEAARKYRTDDRHVIESHETLDIVEENYTPTGERREVRVLKSPVFDDAGNVTGVHGVFWESAPND
ncbi:MAG: PAS domain-containing protein [Phycisphaera sp.]|nr:PAS domain-containing protein [Phycisphaera sp.]